MKKYLLYLFLFITLQSNAQIWETNEQSHKREPPSSDEILRIGLIVLAILGLTYGIAAMRKGTSYMSRPGRILSQNANVSIEKVMKIIIQFAKESGYKIDDFNESKSIIVLSDSATLTSYGFFYPIYLTIQNENLTQIEVGIKSKLFQIGPIVSRRHEKCFNGIKAAIYASS